MSLSKQLLFCVAVVLAGRTSGAQPPLSATLLGTVSDANERVLPGVTLVVRVGDRDVTTVATSAGRYEFSALPAGAHTLTAGLAGFRSYKTEIELKPGERVTLDFTLCVGGVQHIDWVAPPHELADLLAEVDAVAYVRILTNDGRAGDCEADAAKLTAKVLDLVRPDRIENGTLTFWQELWYEEPAPYRVGTELFVFLKRWKDRYVRAYGPIVVFPVADGKLQPSKFLFYDRYVGWSDRAFLKQLREWRQR